jgi:hypothetical protein
MTRHFACLDSDLLRNISFFRPSFPVFFTPFSSRIPLFDWADDLHDQSRLCCRSSPLLAFSILVPAGGVFVYPPASITLNPLLTHTHFRRHGCENDVFFPILGHPKDSVPSFGKPVTVILLRGSLGLLHWLATTLELSLQFSYFYLAYETSSRYPLFPEFFSHSPSIDRTVYWMDSFRNNKYPLCAIE